MNKVIYVAYQNDLYEVVYTPEGHVVTVTRYPESMVCRGEELVFWRLPEQLKERILNRIIGE